MVKPLFVWLGSGRAKKNHVGEAGRLLDQAARAGLPVPPGAILLDAFYRIALEEGLARRAGDLVSIDDPELFHNTLFYSVRLPRFDRPVALVRLPAQGPANGPRRPPGQTVDAADPLQTARAFERVWNAAAVGQDDRVDVLIQEQIAAVHAGLAVINAGEGGDRIVQSITSPPKDGLSPGGEPVLLPRLARFQRPDDGLPPHERRLQMLLRGLRRTFNDLALDVGWADDGRICWLEQISAHLPEAPPV